MCLERGERSDSKLNLIGGQIRVHIAHALVMDRDDVEPGTQLEHFYRHVNVAAGSRRADVQLARLFFRVSDELCKIGGGCQRIDRVDHVAVVEHPDVFQIGQWIDPDRPRIRAGKHLALIGESMLTTQILQGLGADGTARNIQHTRCPSAVLASESGLRPGLFEIAAR